jgi:hypothetical protein
MGEVTSLYIVVALLVGDHLECGSSHSKVVDCASYIQLAELSGVALLLSPFTQSC